MPRFRKRPIVIEAEQWFPGKRIEGVREPPDNPVPTEKMMKGTAGWSIGGISGRGKTPLAWIETFEIPILVWPGDWIITGIQGEKYPCKPDIFGATYEWVDDDWIAKGRKEHCARER